jgi:hypothetical protein
VLASLFLDATQKILCCLDPPQMYHSVNAGPSQVACRCCTATGPLFTVSSCLSAGPLAGTPILAPYLPLEALQRKRLAARRHKTTFCYDFPSVFGNALRQAWDARAAAGEPDSGPPPGPLIGLQELCAAPTEDARAPWTVTTVDRPIGGNDVGIVAWRLALRTPECPGGREVRCLLRISPMLMCTMANRAVKIARLCRVPTKLPCCHRWWPSQTTSPTTLGPLGRGRTLCSMR